MWWSLLSKPINVCSRQRVCQFETVLDIGLGRIREFDQDRCCVLTDFRVTWVPCKTAADVLLRHRQIRHTFTNMHSMLLVNGDPTTGSQQQSIKYLVPFFVDIFLWFEKSQSCSGLGLHMSWSLYSIVLDALLTTTRVQGAKVVVVPLSKMSLLRLLGNYLFAELLFLLWVTGRSVLFFAHCLSRDVWLQLNDWFWIEDYCHIWQ